MSNGNNSGDAVEPVEVDVTASHWERVKHWFHEALEQPDEARTVWVQRELAHAPDLRDEVLSLLGALESDDEERFESPLNEWSSVTESVLAPDSEVGPWLIVRKIGEGGMATVYEAVRKDENMRKRAALKTVRTISNASLRKRFARERRILATIEHPNIASLLDGGTLQDGRPWLAMEYVEGERIDHWCATRRLDLRQRVLLLTQVCRAVDAAHRHLVVHRDLKPGNILVTSDGAVKLLDFGIAKLVAGAGRDDTATGALMLTTDYASPEQLRGDPITAASDIYSLGVVAFELFSGMRPFAMRGHGLREMMRLADTEAPRLTQVVNELSARDAGFESGELLRSSLAGDLELVVAKALRKEASERYASAAHLADDLNAWLESRPVSAHPPSMSYALGRMLARNRRVLLALGSVAVFGTLMTAVTVFQTRRADAERARADQRMEEVRALANTLVFDINDRLQDIPGATALRASLVRTAVDALDKASTDAPSDPRLMRELAFAYQRAGDVLGNPTQPNLGDSKGAVEAYSKGRRIAEVLSKQMPNDPEALWTLAITYEKSADVEAPSGELEQALQHQRESLALFRRIATFDSARPQYRRAVGISALKLGDLLGHPAFTNTGDTSAAIAAYQEAVSELDRATRAGDTSYFVRRHHAVVQERLGRLMQERRDFIAARRWLEGSLSLRQLLQSEAPRSVQSRRDVAISWYLLCGLALAENAPQRAIEPCAQSLEIRRVLLAEDPNNGVLVRGMGIMHRRLAEVRARSADTVGALQEFADAVRYYERFLEGRTGALNDRRDYAQLLLERAEVAAATGRPANRSLALRSYANAMAAYDTVKASISIGSDDSVRIDRARRVLGIDR